MRLLWLLLITTAFAGCASQAPADTPLDPVAEATVPAHVQVFTGDVPFGNLTVAGTGKVPSVFGTPGFSYLDRYGPEPTMGVTSSGSLFVVAFSDVLRSTGDGSWSVVQSHEPLLNNDPMLWVDPVTDRIYHAPMFPTLACATVYWSDDDGATWSPPVEACGTGAFDHQKFATALPGPDALPVAGLLHPTVAYLCYNGVAVTNCMASYDGGMTWPVDRPTAANLVGIIASETPSQISPCFSGQNGHPSAAPDGTVAFLRTWSCSQPILTYSTDSGLTWTNVPGPNFPGGASNFLQTANAHSIDPEVAFTPDGTLYTLFQSHDHHAYLARSSDLGATWDGPWDVTPPGYTSTVFAALETGSDGRLAMAFLAAKNVTGSSAQAPAESRWTMQIITTEDADTTDPSGPTFVHYQTTPDETPVQIGPILQGGGTDNTRNLLDFIDGAVAPNGTFYVSFTIGCDRACGERPMDEQAGRASDAAVAWLSGWSLFEADRPDPY